MNHTADWMVVEKSDDEQRVVFDDAGGESMFYAHAPQEVLAVGFEPPPSARRRRRW